MDNISSYTHQARVWVIVFIPFSLQLHKRHLRIQIELENIYCVSIGL